MKVLIEHHHGLPLRALVSRFFLHHADLNLLGNETTDGGTVAGCESSQLLERLPVRLIVTFCLDIFREPGSSP
jgi:hypothetical protein